MLANEFHNLALECSVGDIVPSGPAYDHLPAMYKTCTLPGSEPGSLTVAGDRYLALTYDFHFKHIGRNLAILAAQAVAFLVIGVIATEVLNFAESGRVRIWKRTRATVRRLRGHAHEGDARNGHGGRPSVEQERLMDDANGDDDPEAQVLAFSDEESSVLGTPAHDSEDEADAASPSVEKLEGSVLAVSATACRALAPVSLLTACPSSSGTTSRCGSIRHTKLVDFSIASAGTSNPDESARCSVQAAPVNPPVSPPSYSVRWSWP